MIDVPKRFPHNAIMSLTSEPIYYDLAESIGPDLKLNEVFGEDFQREFLNLALAYGSTSGDETLRGHIAERNGVLADDVVTTVGGMQALFLIAFILCESDTDVVIGSPVFPNAKSVLQAVGANLIELPVSFDQGYRIDIGRVQSLLTRRTKLVSLASPQNPSGVSLTEKEVRDILSAIDRICPDAFLLLDETYREAAYGADTVRPSMAVLDQRVVSCASLSKCHGAPGLRTGWIIARNEALYRQLILGKFNTTISNSRVDDALAIRIMENSDQILGSRRAQLASGLTRIESFVQEHHEMIEWIKPDAGALCCLRLRRNVFDGELVTRFYSALKKQDVRVGPGTWFGEDESIFRVGFGLLSMNDLDEALSRVSQSIKSCF
ncbi:MAG: pyridoxal phosphate-dependent aminotransferase [Acidiferrobacterales bacterium]|nr:pyridoxal phosphate-dependent aminotransferase [Acidiferrobacterales bacterium]